MNPSQFELALEDAAEAMSSPLRGQAGRFPARRFQSHLRQQGFLVTRHFLDRLLERAQGEGIRFNPRTFANDFRTASHFRQTRPGYNTRFALLHGLPVLYRMGGPRGLHPVLVGLLPQGAIPPAVPTAAPFFREADFEQELAAAAAQEMMVGRCPPDRPDTVRGFKRYSNDVTLLTPSEQRKIAAIADTIRTSLSGPTPVIQVNLIGHADLDLARERREPGFMRTKSLQRAAAVSQALQRQLGAANASRIRWSPDGAGATSLAVPSPHTEAERACNRRVEIQLIQGSVTPPTPVPIPPPTLCPAPLLSPSATPPPPSEIGDIIHLVRRILGTLPLGSTGILLPSSARFLDAAEQTEVSRIYGGSLDFTKILIADGLGFQGRQFTVAASVSAGRHVVMLLGDLCSWAPRPTFPGDLRTATLIHELAHAWQSQHHGTDPTAFMENSVRSQVGALADLPVAKAAAASSATALALARGIRNPITLASIAASASAAEEVSAYAYVPGKAFSEYAAEQIAQQVEDAYQGVGTPSPSIVPIMRSVAPNARSTDNETSLTVISFHRKSTPGVIWH
jgi:outer membrane protein OmpA-like peptidoglycan-associated protein